MEHQATSGAVFGCHNWEEQCCWCLVGRGRRSCSHPALHRTDPHDGDWLSPRSASWEERRPLGGLTHDAGRGVSGSAVHRLRGAEGRPRVFLPPNKACSLLGTPFLGAAREESTGAMGSQLPACGSAVGPVGAHTQLVSRDFGSPAPLRQPLVGTCRPGLAFVL